MTPYLITGGEAPWTAEDIREQLGLLDHSFDGLIEAAIASQCFKAGCSFRGEIWAVKRSDDLAAFYRSVRRLGRIVKIGPAYQRGKDTYHDCEFTFDPVKARKAFRSIINWCWDDHGISSAILRERRGEYRQPRFLEAAE